MAVYDITIEVDDEMTPADLKALLEESMTVLQLTKWKVGDVDTEPEIDYDLLRKQRIEEELAYGWDEGDRL